MRAIAITDDHQLEFADLPEPIPGDGEVLIDVVAAGVNRADLAQAAGKYPPPAGASPLPGLEVSGHRRDTGEAVVALLAGGGYAEVVAVPEVQVLPTPPALSLADAGGLIETAATVVSNLVIEAGLPSDGSASQTVLIHGGNGGIGTFAIQFVHALGHSVLTTVGSDAGAEEARLLGADEAWNRHTTDVSAAVKALGGADVILDVVGGAGLKDNVRMLRERGRLVIIGLLGGSHGELDIGLLMSKRARVIGTTLRSQQPSTKGEILARTRELVWPMLEAGTIRIAIEAHVPLKDAAAAHRILSAGGHFGKVILDVAD